MTINLKASAKGLNIVRGYSFEEICSLLSKEEIPHKVMREPYTTNQYWRQSAVRLEEENLKKRYAYFDRIRELFKVTRASGDGMICFAEYRITPMFDFSALDGHPRFRKGLLVEATWVH